MSIADYEKKFLKGFDERVENYYFYCNVVVHTKLGNANPKQKDSISYNSGTYRDASNKYAPSVKLQR